MSSNNEQSAGSVDTCNKNNEVELEEEDQENEEENSSETDDHGDDDQLSSAVSDYIDNVIDEQLEEWNRGHENILRQLKKIEKDIQQRIRNHKKHILEQNLLETSDEPKPKKPKPFSYMGWNDNQA